MSSWALFYFLFSFCFLFGLMFKLRKVEILCLEILHGVVNSTDIHLEFMYATLSEVVVVDDVGR